MSQEDLQKRIEVILDEIDSAESDLSSAIEESRDLAMKTFQIDQQISECSMMQERYGVLRSQYSSDIQRLTFIIEGELHKAGLPKMARCLFCDGEIKKKEEESCAEAAKEEVKRLLPQIQDLEDAMMDADLEAAQLAKERDELHKTRKELEDRINSEMKPKLTELREALSKYSRAIEERKEDSVYVKFMSDVGGRIRDLEDTVNRKEMYCIEEDFEKLEFIKNFEMVFKTVLEQTNYGDISSALFSFSDYDVIVNNKQKYRYGQGYRAFLNTDILIALQEYLRQYGKHQPRDPGNRFANPYTEREAG